MNIMAIVLPGPETPFYPFLFIHGFELRQHVFHHLGTAFIMNNGLSATATCTASNYFPDPVQ